MPNQNEQNLFPSGGCCSIKNIKNCFYIKSYHISSTQLSTDDNHIMYRARTAHVLSLSTEAPWSTKLMNLIEFRKQVLDEHNITCRFCSFWTLETDFISALGKLTPNLTFLCHLFFPILPSHALVYGTNEKDVTVDKWECDLSTPRRSNPPAGIA